MVPQAQDSFPQAPATLMQERLGVAAVALAAARMNLIWRETSASDVGVDGHLEFVDARGQATGRLVGVQIKSGESFFQQGDDRTWYYYPNQKHRNYWERYPLPMLLVLHSPKNDVSYWVDARQALRSPEQSSWTYLAVPKNNVLQNTQPELLFRTAGVSEDSFIENLHDVLNSLIQTRSCNGSFPVSWFDLFVLGLTNICRSLYFGMDLAWEIAEFNLNRDDTVPAEVGVGIGPQEHDFLFDYVRFLVSQHLADVDYADYLIEWDEPREQQSHFVAPLTQRGRHLVRMISEEEDKLVTTGALNSGEGLRVAQEGLVVMLFQTFFRRLPRVARFQELAKTTPPAKPES